MLPMRVWVDIICGRYWVGGEGGVSWRANTLSPAAQRGVLDFFSNNGSQIGSLFLEWFWKLVNIAFERNSCETHFPTLLFDRLAGMKWILGRQWKAFLHLEIIPYILRPTSIYFIKYFSQRRLRFLWLSNKLSSLIVPFAIWACKSISEYSD